MTVIAEYELPADDFVLGRAAVPDLSVELERLLRDRDRAVCYFWAANESEGFEQSLSAEPALEEFRTIDGVGDRQFYRCVCAETDASLVDALCRFDVAVLSAGGDHERWQFRVAFEGTGVLSEFQSYCVDTAAVALELVRLYDPVDAKSRVDSELTPRQRETLITAYREGYFDIPRKITLVDLAEQLQVSDQAISERLRRGESKLVRRHLLED